MSEQTPNQIPSDTPHPDEHLRQISHVMVNELGRQAVSEAQAAILTSPLIPRNTSRELDRELQVDFDSPATPRPEDVVADAEQTLQASDAMAGIDGEYAELIARHGAAEAVVAQGFA